MSGPNVLLYEKEYSVTVGLAKCTVRCYSEKEAVRLARLELGRQMPQMWDIIQGISDRQFRVTQAG